ncbi:unnamed protein product, partial [Amoebophrya sp. A25]
FDWDGDENFDFSDFEDDVDEDEDELDGEQDDGENDDEASEGVLGQGDFAYPELPGVELLATVSPKKKRKTPPAATTFVAPRALSLKDGAADVVGSATAFLNDDEGKWENEDHPEGRSGFTLAIYGRFPFTDKLFEPSKNAFHIRGSGYQGPCVPAREVTLVAKTDKDGNAFVEMELSSTGESGAVEVVQMEEDWPF